MGAHSVMRSFVASLVLLVGASSAFGADRLFTVSGIDDGSERSAGGSIVADETGRRYVVKDKFFSELTGEVGAITFMADVGDDGKTLEVKWARAVVTDELKVGGKKLAKGTELKVLGRKAEPHHPEDGDILSRWRVTLPDGKTVNLSTDDEFSISVEETNGKVSSDRMEGVVRAVGSDLFLDRVDGKSVKLVGRTTAVLKDAVGLHVEGYGLSYGAAGTFEFGYVEGATKKATRARTTTTSKAKTTNLDKHERVSLVNANKPGFYTIRINWPGIGSGAGVRQAFVKREDVVVGARWVVAEGTVASKEEDGSTVYTIKTASETFTVATGLGGLRSDMLADRVGKTVKFGGAVLIAPSYEHGELELKWLESTVAKDIPAKDGHAKIAKGTPVKLFDVTSTIVDADGYSVVLPDGKVAKLVKEDLAVGAPSATPGLTGAITPD